MPSIEQLNSEKESLLKQKNLRDERFEEQLQEAIAENKDRYNPNTGTINVLSESEIQKMRDKHNDEMHKEYGEKIEDIDIEINKINTLQENIKKSNEEMETIKVKIAEKDKEMEKAEADAKALEAEYNQAITAAFHGENATGVIDPSVSENFNNKKAELTGKMNELTNQRESLLRELSNYEINTKTMERELDRRLNDIPEVKENNTQNPEEKQEGKPGTYDSNGSYIMTEEEEKSWRESLEDDRDSIDTLLDEGSYQSDTEDRIALDNAIKELNNKKSKSNVEELHSDILIKNGRMYLAFGQGIKDFKMLMDDQNKENTVIEEAIKNFCEGENAIFEPQELAALLSNSGSNAIDVYSKEDIFKNATDLNEVDKNIVANIINYFKGEITPETMQKIKPEMKKTVRNYLNTIRQQEKAMNIIVDIKDKKEWGTTNKALTNLNAIKDWAYINRNKDGIDVESTAFTKMGWAWKNFVRNFRGYEETLPPVKEENSKSPDLSDVEKPETEDIDNDIDMEIANKAVEKIVEDAEREAEVQPELEVKPEIEPEQIAAEPIPEPEPEPEKGTTERFNWLIKNKKEEKGEEKMEGKKDEAYYDEILRKANEAAQENVNRKVTFNEETLKKLSESEINTRKTDKEDEDRDM